MTLFVCVRGTKRIEVNIGDNNVLKRSDVS